MRKNYYIYILLLLISNVLLSQEVQTEKEKKHPFRVYETDRLYTPFQYPRSFISRLFFSKNFGFESAMKEREPDGNWDFKDIAVHVNGRVGSEILFYRNNIFTVGLAYAMNISIFGRKNGIFDVYDFFGEFAPFFDLYLKEFNKDVDIKIRILPVYHQSSHYVDGYQGETYNLPRGGSYEFFSMLLHYRFYSFLTYLGFEATYTSSGNSVPIFRLVSGIDYRYKLFNNDISLITGIHLGALYQKKDRLLYIKENIWSPSVNFGVGLEFYRYVLSFKISYDRPYGAVGYFREQFQVGGELTLFF